MDHRLIFYLALIMRTSWYRISYFFSMNQRNNHIAAFVSAFILVVSGCVEPYQPPAIQLDVDILVIDGFLNSEDGSAIIRLTHANALSDKNMIQPELNASVSIQDDMGNTYALIEQDTGTYALTGLNINPTAKYMLSVRTANEAEYASDFVNIISSPPIDSITWTGKDDGVYVLVNTHDDTGNTRYYRWDYVETWKYHAAVSSDWKLVGKVPVYRTDDERIYTCWRTLPSTKISITTSVRLAEDIVSQYPIAFVPKGSTKITDEYSILVKQRAVSKAEYDFLEQLQKTTESLGGLFDPQPSQVIGNVHSLSDPSATVLGYFSAGATTEERLFIDYYNLPDPLKKLTSPVGCEVDSISNSDLQNFSGYEVLAGAIYSGPFIVGYTVSSTACADCRFQGGVTTKPAFWP